MNGVIKKAFTLIELLVVIAIIGILSGLIIVTMNGMTNKANIAKAQVFSNSLRSTLMMRTIAQYTFDDITDYDPATKIINSTGGNIPDSWSDNEGRAYNNPILKDGNDCISDKCVSFDGADDYIELPDSPDLRLTTGGTISAWIYPKSLGESAGRLIDKGVDLSMTNGYGIFIGANNYISMKVNAVATQTVSSNNSVTFNQWQLVTITFNNYGRKIYINGIDKTSSGGTQTALPPNVAGSTRIGQRAGATDRTFDGLIDDIRIYNATIPTSQIKEQYYAGLNSLLNSGRINKEEYQNRLVGMK
ncbi:MAG: LamG domain-containing protein [Candidatus Paceibacterota bacterium]|jgi:prepilin-type N-terminal cleavage/methylation domain-containing protein